MIKNIKKVLSGIVSASVLSMTIFCPIIADATPSATIDIPNYAIAEGFEDGTVGNALRWGSYWDENAATPASDATKLEVANEGANGSSKSLKVTQMGAASFYIPITVLPNTTYNISFWIKYGDPQVEGGTVTSKLTFGSTNNGTSLNNPTLSKDAVTRSATLNTWTHFEFTLNSTNTEVVSTGGVVFRPYNASGFKSGERVVYYDEIEIAPVQTTENLVNGSFDTNTTVGAWGNASVYNVPGTWMKWASNSAHRKGTFAWVSSETEGNPTAGHLSRTTGTAVTGLSTPCINLEPGKSYLVSAMFKSGLENVTFSDDYALVERLALQYGDPGSTNASGTTLYAGSTGASSGSLVTSKWTKRDVVITIPGMDTLTYMAKATPSGGSVTVSSIAAKDMETTYPGGTMDEATGVYSGTTVDGTSFTVYTKPYFKWLPGNASGSYTPAGGASTAAQKYDPLLVDEIRITDLSVPGELQVTAPSVITEGSATTGFAVIDSNTADVKYTYKKLTWNDETKNYYISGSGNDLKAFVPSADDAGKKLMFIVQGVCPTANSDGTYNIGAPVIVETNEVVALPKIKAIEIDGQNLVATIEALGQGSFIAAAYDNERNLLKAAIVEPTEIIDNTITFTSFTSGLTDVETYTVYAWVDTVDIIPICDSKSCPAE